MIIVSSYSVCSAPFFHALCSGTLHRLKRYATYLFLMKRKNLLRMKNLLLSLLPIIY